MSVVQWIDMPCLEDERGALVALEENQTVPFSIKRIYYLFDTSLGSARGYHAHKKLNQVAICVSGKCRMVLDDGRAKQSVWLDSPMKGLLIKEMVWREIHDFSENCVLVVIASQHYDESDYIRDYSTFLEAVE